MLTIPAKTEKSNARQATTRTAIPIGGGGGGVGKGGDGNHRLTASGGIGVRVHRQGAGGKIEAELIVIGRLQAYQGVKRERVLHRQRR